MRTLIADLVVEIPEVGDLVSRCENYMYYGERGADVVIRTDLLERAGLANLTKDQKIYLLSGTGFYGELLRFNGIMLHASAVEYNGKAYLFSANSGVGKSTHTQIWQREFGASARVFNDDKPALRYVDGRWYAYGTPWCGKDGININCKVPVAGICFLKQAPKNSIRRLSKQEAITNLIAQTLRGFGQIGMVDLMVKKLDRLIQDIPVFELENRPEPEAAWLSYETMNRAAKELGL